MRQGERLRLARLAERRLGSTCEITREAGKIFDDDTGLYEHALEILDPESLAFIERDVSGVYDIDCDAHSADGRDRVVELGGELVTLRLYPVRLPVAVIGVRVDDVITIVTSPDPEMVGKALRVRDFPGDDLGVTRLVLTEEQL